MREIVFDTETTGLDNQADRIIEIGAVELDNRFVTGRSFHVFVNPDGREVHPEALAVHGISNEMLADKPRFADIAEQWIEFVGDAKLIAHNASFDVGFFDAELQRVGLPLIDASRVIDSLALARRKHPMGPNSLDALCQRYGIDNSHRTKHGALLDSELLAEVYVELCGGKQAALGLSVAEEPVEGAMPGSGAGPVSKIEPRPNPLPSRLTAAEVAAHEEMLKLLGDKPIWRRQG